MKLIIILLIVILLLPNVALAYNPYGEIYTYEVYYNGKLLSGTEVAKPVLKIGEQFSVRMDVTLNQYSKLFIELSLLDENMFDFIDGPAEFNQYATKIFEANETHTFEWTLKPTDEWAGGTMPVNINYAIYVPDQYEPLVNSEFTIAYPYISTEHYEGDSTTTNPDSPTSTESPNSIPAFTLLTTALAIALATRKQ
ncbi:MAG TPA: sarcinarray family MAST domain-containing protein [Methanosarcinaceae archaeon]|nr:sarcinarray family MAST domain-containing protein [Methanosarcinaceae archaeon]